MGSSRSLDNPDNSGSLLWRVFCAAVAVAGIAFLIRALETDRLSLWLYDFEIFWRGGRRILAGIAPYKLRGFYNPLPLAVLFAPLALLPLRVAYGLFVLGTLLLLWKVTGRRGVWALLSFPVLFSLIVGQVDLVLALATALLGPLALPLLLAKPQIAFVTLPWFLIHGDRRRLAIGMLAAIAMLGLCFWLRPTWFAEWRAASPPLWDYSQHDSNLYRLAPAGAKSILVWILTPIGLALGVWLRARPSSWAVLHLIDPVTNLYSAAVLAEWIGPLEVVLSWAAFAVVRFHFHGGAPMYVVALAVLARQRVSRLETGADSLRPREPLLD